MKRILLFLMTFLGLGYTSYAQPAHLDIHSMPHVCSDVEVTVYAIESGTCNIIGQTITFLVSPVPAPQINLVPPYSPAIWVTDPNVTCPGCVWEWGYATVSTPAACQVSPSTPLNCNSSGYDLLTVGIPHCGYIPDDHFTYSGSCGSCSAGDCRHAHFHPNGVHID